MLDILQVTDPGCCGERRLDEDSCCVTCGRDFFDPDTGEEVGDGTRVPNARLIGTALEMLEKLIEIHAYFIDQFGESEGTEEIAALIAKAKGEADPERESTPELWRVDKDYHGWAVRA